MIFFFARGFYPEAVFSTQFLRKSVLGPLIFDLKLVNPGEISSPARSVLPHKDLSSSVLFGTTILGSCWAEEWQHFIDRVR